MSTFGTPSLIDILDEHDRAALAKLGNRVAYLDGQLVHDRGDVGTALGVVVSGTVGLFRTRADGRLVFVSAIDAGQNFGDAISIAGSDRTHHAVAIGQTVIDHFGPREIAIILQGHPAIVLALLKVASFRLKTAIEMLDDARMLRTEVRLAKMLRRMANVTGDRAIVPILHDVLCQILGLSSVSVAHALGSLRKQGLVQTGYRQIIIPKVVDFDSWLAIQDWE